MSPIRYNIKECDVEEEEVSSKVSLEDVWDSHPSLYRRVQAAKKLNIKQNENNTAEPAWDIINDNLKEEISLEIIQPQEPNFDIASLNTIDDKEFIEQVEKVLEISIFPKETEIFLNRCITINEDKSVYLDDKQVANPFTKENELLIRQYTQALEDEKVLLAIIEKKIPIKEFRYDGEIYSVSHVPINTHKEYVKDLKAKVDNIDQNMLSYIFALYSRTNSDNLLPAFDALQYAQNITVRLNNDFIPVMEDIIKELNSSNISGGEDLQSIIDWLSSYERALRSLILDINYKAIAPFIGREEYEALQYFTNSSNVFYNSLRADAVNHIFILTDIVLSAHNKLAHKIKMLIANIAVNREAGDLKFLEPWIKTNEIENADDTQGNYSTNSFERLAKEGNVEYQRLLGERYLDKTNPDYDPERAIFWLVRAASNRDIDSINILWRYFKDNGDYENFRRYVMYGIELGIPECKEEGKYII